MSQCGGTKPPWTRVSGGSQQRDTADPELLLSIEDGMFQQEAYCNQYMQYVHVHHSCTEVFKNVRSGRIG